MKIKEIEGSYSFDKWVYGVPVASKYEFNNLMLDKVGYTNSQFTGGAGSYTLLDMSIEPIIFYKVPPGKRAKILKTINKNINFNFSSIHSTYYNQGNNRGPLYQMGGLGKNSSPLSLEIGNISRIEINPITFDSTKIIYEKKVLNNKNTLDNSLAYEDLENINMDNYFLLEGEEIRFNMKDFELYSMGSHYQSNLNTRHTLELNLFMHILEEDNK